MSGNTPTERKYTKIKNFTEKDQVRIKYSLLGKEKKLMLSVYIGEDVYNQLTDGREYKRLNTTYIPGDMVVISPTNDDKGLIHRYNGRGMFKTTCVRISLGKMKGLKLSKRDFTNRVVEYSVLYGGIDEPSNALRIDISNSKKIRFTVKPQDALDRNKKPILIGDFKDSVYSTKQKDREDKKPEKERYSSQVFTPLGERVLGPSEETVLTNTKADKKPDKSTYIPRMDHKLDEILKKHEDLAEAVVSIYELLNNELVRIKGKDEFESPDIDIRNSYNSNIAKQKIEGSQIPYIPFNDLDEINEKVYEIIQNQKSLSEAILSVHELLTSKEKDEFESPDINKRIAMLEARFYRLELALEEKNKSLFEKIFGK